MSRISDFSQGLPEVIRHLYVNQVFVSPQTSPANFRANVHVRFTPRFQEFEKFALLLRYFWKKF